MPDLNPDEGVWRHLKRVRDGRLVEGSATWDWLAAVTQLGATVTAGADAVEPRPS